MFISKSLVHPHFQYYMQVCDLISKNNTVETEWRKKYDYALETGGDCHRTFLNDKKLQNKKISGREK